MKNGVLTTESAKHAIDIFRSQVASELQIAVDLAAKNAGYRLFGAWSGGAAPANSAFHELHFLDGIGIGTAALGYGVSNVSNEGRSGIYLKPYVDSPATLLTFKAQDPDFVRSIVEGSRLFQGKARMRVIAMKNGEPVNRLLLRVPHL